MSTTHYLNNDISVTERSSDLYLQIIQNVQQDIIATSKPFSPEEAIKIAARLLSVASYQMDSEYFKDQLIENLLPELSDSATVNLKLED